MSTNDPDPPSRTRFSEGQTVAGFYALSRCLSVGDGPEVWLAHDEVSGKDVTLHFLPPAIIKDSSVLKELRRDIERNRRFAHPNILRAYELVEDPEWTAISTDALEGESLTVLLAMQRGGRFTVPEIEPWGFQLVQTIEDAHRIHTLHRDLAPQNIFLTPAGKVLVAHFGVSRTIQDALAGAGAADEKRVVYTCPQVLEGVAPAHTDDIYSLGAIFYLLLAGKPPFTGEDLVGQVRAGATPNTLSVLATPKWDVPPSWQRTIAASLQKPPESRPQSAGEFLRSLKTGIVAPATADPLAEESLAKPAIIALPVTVPETKPDPVVEKVEPKAAAPVMKSKRFEPATSTPAVRVEPKHIEFKIESPKKSGGRLAVRDVKAPLHPDKSRFPIVLLGFAVAVLLLLASLIYYIATLGKKSTENGGSIAHATPPPVDSPSLSSTPSPPTGVTAPPSPATVATQAASPQPPAHLSDEEKAIAVLQAVLGQAKLSAQAAEKTHADLVQQQQAAEAAVAEKTKVSEAAKLALNETVAKQKKLEEDQKVAEAAAQEAQKIAAEKARVVEEGQHSLADLGRNNEANVAAQQKANTELETAEKAFTEKQRLAADADAERQRQLAAVTKGEQDLEAAKAALVADQRKQAADEAERKKLDQVVEMKTMDKTSAAPQENQAPAEAQLPVSTSTRPETAPPDPANPAMLATLAPATPQPAASGSEAVNSLGMKFVPVGDVEFCVWLTRVQDFQAFAEAVNLESTSWKKPGFRQGPDHPVVNVTWLEAIAFCTWLANKEHKDHVLPENQFYRLPTDLEWSLGVGLPKEAGKTPEARDMGIPDVYPWGTQWPPPPGAGNYTGEETDSDVGIKGYNDGFVWTSPVGSFKPNKYGLYDMGGNVWQWCMDTWSNKTKVKVLRGASWYNGALRPSLLSSCRMHAPPDSSTDNYGFRIVRASYPGKPDRK